MAGGVDVNIGADTRGFERAVKSGVQQPVEDAQKALDEYVKAGDRAGDELTGTFRTQQQQTKELRDEITTLNRTIASSSRPAYRAAAADADRFKRDSSEAFDEVRDSAKSNAIEMGASFTGGFDQLSGGLQGFLAEFAAGFGPGGLIAGILAAGGLGIIAQQITKANEEADKQKEKISALTDEYLETERAGKRSFESVEAAIREMATAKPEDVAITLREAWKAAQESGQDYGDIVTAVASGSRQDIERVRGSLARVYQQQQDLVTQQIQSGRVGAEAGVKLRDAQGKLARALQVSGDAAKEAERAQKLAAKAGLSDFRLKADLIGQLEEAFDDAASGSDHFNKKTGEFEVGPFLRDVRKVRRELKEYRDDIVKSDLSPEARKFIESQGAEQAAAMLRGYKAASPDHQRELNEIWSTSGVTDATSYADALGKKFKGMKVAPPKVDRPVIPTPNTAALDRFMQTPYVKRVTVEAYTRNGARVF